MNRRALRRKLINLNPMRKGAYAFAILAFACLLNGFYISVTNHPNQITQTEYTTITGQAEINCPNPLWNSTLPLTIYYNITSQNFTQNEPVDVQIDLMFYNQGELSILNFNPVRIKIINAIENSSSRFPFGIPSEFYLENDYNTTIGDNPFLRYWRGNQTVKFQATGTPQMEIELTVVFTPEARAIVDDMFTDEGNSVSNGSEYDYMRRWQPFTQSITIPTVNIESAKVAKLEEEQRQQAINQKIAEKTTGSLTYIVLFFASFDIAVVLYDHSDKENKKPHNKNHSKNHNTTSHWKMKNRTSQKQHKSNKNEGKH